MTETQTRNLIAKLSRLTEARGATPAEAACAREKVARLEQTLPKTTRPYRDPVYVEGWPGQPVCDHYPDRARYDVDKKLVCRKCGHMYIPSLDMWK